MKYTIKDITTVEAAAIIIHGVNCHGAMASGVAKSLYKKWPRVKSEYIDYGTMNFGDIQPISVEKRLWVVNCFTQGINEHSPGVYAITDAIDLCLRRVICFAEAVNIFKVFSPRIGCGVGGLDWDKDVLPIFDHYKERNRQIDFTICDIE